MAFANFHWPHEAQAVVDKLNNYMLNDRRLFTELKKKKLSPEEERAKILTGQIQPCQSLQRMDNINRIDCIEYDALDPQVKPQIISREQLALIPVKSMCQT